MNLRIKCTTSNGGGEQQLATVELERSAPSPSGSWPISQEERAYKVVYVVCEVCECTVSNASLAQNINSDKHTLLLSKKQSLMLTVHLRLIAYAMLKLVDGSLFRHDSLVPSTLSSASSSIADRMQMCWLLAYYDQTGNAFHVVSTAAKYWLNESNMVRVEREQAVLGAALSMRASGLLTASQTTTGQVAPPCCLFIFTCLFAVATFGITCGVIYYINKEKK